MFSVGNKVIRNTIPYIKPIVDERKAKMEELGDGWSDKPVSIDRELFTHYV